LQHSQVAEWVVRNWVHNEGVGYKVHGRSSSTGSSPVLTTKIKTMEEYKKWLEKQIERCLEDKDLQREHWAFCKAYEKLIELVK